MLHCKSQMKNTLCRKVNFKKHRYAYNKERKEEKARQKLQAITLLKKRMLIKLNLEK